MAALTGRFIVAVALAGVVAAAIPAPASGQDGSPGPTPSHASTCSDRFPAEGPAGVDLRLGCIVSELVGLYTASGPGQPPTLSAYVLGLAAGVGSVAVLVLAAVRLLARRTSRRLAPVLPSEWWVCPSCRSVNATAASRCYACGSPPDGGPTMPTDPSPETPQSAGRSPDR